MSLFYLTNMSLDILWGVTWWVLKKTRNGINYFVFPKTIKDKEKNRIVKLEEDNKRQRDEIVLLREKIEVINNYLLTQKVN